MSAPKFFMTADYGKARWGRIYGFIAALAVALVLMVFLFLILGKQFSRYQALADARNRVKISTIEIKNQKQRIIVAKQTAAIRQQDAVGVREAQDEIAKTLTPLYVQFEMVDALKQIARSGKNNSVVYLPSGANGIPLVSTVNPDHVGQPAAG